MMNTKQRIRLNELDPRDPDHDDLEELQAHWVQRYMLEYAANGTMGGEDAADLELDTQLVIAKQAAIMAMVRGSSKEWDAYTDRLQHLIMEAAEEAVSDNWESIKQDTLEQCDGL